MPPTNPSPTERLLSELERLERIHKVAAQGWSESLGGFERALKRLRSAAPGLIALVRAMAAEHAAAECIRHWHDSGRNDEGMVVSSEHVRLLWEASEKTQAAIAAFLEGTNAR